MVANKEKAVSRRSQGLDRWLDCRVRSLVDGECDMATMFFYVLHFWWER